MINASASATSATEPIQALTENDDLYGFVVEQNDETAVYTEVNADVEL
jgi:hypothetical protein